MTKPAAISGPNVQRAGFTKNVTSTNAGKAPSGGKGLVKSGSFSSKTYKGGPALKSHSGAAGKSVPAFSKKKI